MQLNTRTLILVYLYNEFSFIFIKLYVQVHHISNFGSSVIG